tara:strand:+ start:1030 stop:3021 length:1992 start_codon:yes stop_codon:yes gene_type:complete
MTLLMVYTNKAYYRRRAKMTNDVFYLPPDDPDLDREYITGEEFQRGTKTAVRTLSSDFDTDVVFAGEQAKTDGKQVVLPLTDADKMMTHRQVEVGRGYANHETLHKLLTDFDSGQAWLRKQHEEGKHYTASMGQAIEDVRIENGGVKLYSGIGKSVDKTAEQVCKEFKKIADKQPEICKDPWKVLPVAVTWAGRIKIGYPSATIKQALANLSPEIQDRANKIADAVLSIPHGVKGVGQVNQSEAHEGSRQGMQFAERVVQELAKDVPPPPPEEQEKEVEGNSGSGSGKDNDEAHNGEAEQNKSQTRGHGASSSELETTLIQTEPHAFDPNLDQVTKHFSREHEKHKGHSVQKGSFTYDGDKIEEPRQALREAEHYRVQYDKIKKNLGSRLATMKRKLEKALITKLDIEYESSRSGRLHLRGRAPQIMMGMDNVRRRRTEGNEIDTAVSILVDCSGSMSGSPMALAGQSAIALGECLQSGRIPFEIIGHTTFHWRKEMRELLWEAHDKGFRYERECGVYMPVFKPFNKELNKCKHLMGFIPTAADNSNADADAILMCADRLMQRTESNKIMMVLADGYPAWHGSRGGRSQNEITRDAVDKVDKMGIKSVGIGIDCDSVKQFFPRWVVVNDVDDLAKNTLDQVAKMILGDRFHIDNSDLIKAKAS